MNLRELWLKLFTENDTALACAIHLCQRFVDDKQLENGAEFIEQKRRELYCEVPAEQVALVFPGDPALSVTAKSEKNEAREFWKEARELLAIEATFYSSREGGSELAVPLNKVLQTLDNILKEMEGKRS